MVGAMKPRTTGARRRAALILALAVTAPCAASAAPPTRGSLSMQYEGFAHGLLVLRLAGTLTLADSGYTGHLAIHTAGMINWLSHMDNQSDVRGHFAGTVPMPDHYQSAGTARGTYKTMQMAYPNGNPAIERQTPYPDPTRTVVPPAEATGAIDDLSAIVLLVRRVGDGLNCDGSLKLYDGRRLTELTAHTVGIETIRPSSRSRYGGTAMRCDFEGTRTAGFLKSDSEAQQRRPRHGSAWLAPIVPGAPPVPLRITFDNQVLGNVTLYLTDVTGTPGPVAQNVTGARVQ
jgi:hypothetical protein